LSIKTKFRRDIQALRGLAVLAVVLFHANENIFSLGYLGVDVFFVISGFVVTPLVLRIFVVEENGGGLLSNLSYFYRRRFFRLAPALAAILITSTILVFFLGSPSIHQRFAMQGIATLLLLGNLGAYRYSGDYFSPSPNPLVHTWSLSVEEQIYIFLPIFLMLILYKRHQIKKLFGISVVLLTSISFISFMFPELLHSIYAKFGIAIAEQISFYSPIDRFWQFGVGGICYLFLEKHNSQKKLSP
jgi:peptidoglycan/LPS O-acetylase OafA/YrhL